MIPEQQCSLYQQSQGQQQQQQANSGPSPQANLPNPVGNPNNNPSDYTDPFFF
jgi:hypothetical protein